MEMSWDEAVARIRAEVIAGDWRLNQRRATALELALTVLEPAAAGRRSFRYLFEMARVALAYQEKYGDESPPMVLDFLKQALAQVMKLLEDDCPSTEKDTEIFNKVHLSFMALKQHLARIRAGK